jgi:hypothetical protein
VHHVAAPAAIAASAVVAEPAHRAPIADLPVLDVVPDGLDVPRDLVAGRHGKDRAEKVTGSDLRIRVTHPARLNPDPDLAAAGLEHRPIGQVNRAARLGDFNSAIGSGHGSPFDRAEGDERSAWTGEVEHHSEAGTAGHHALVGFWCIAEGQRFDHRSDLMGEAESEVVLVVDR